MRDPLIAARIFNTPLMVDAAKLRVVEPFLTQRFFGGSAEFIYAENINFAGDPPRQHMGKLGFSGDEMQADRHGHQLVKRTRNGVGVISIEGTLINKGGWIGMSSGETSYQGIIAQVTEARDDPTIRAVVFEVDSYGGEVPGAFDCAAAIRDLSQEKPTLAIQTDDALSAGYLLGCQARQVIVPATGSSGSVGVVTMHTDLSAAAEKAGVKITVLASGAHKADGHSFAPLPDDVAERIMARLEASRQLFAEAVAAGRGNRLTKEAALATEAACFYGDEAVDAGLADAVARPTEAFAEFVAMF